MQTLPKAARSGQSGSGTVRREERHPFHAVEICGNPESCQAALRCAGLRFLSRESPPTLPMRYCDRPGQCTCRYRHHDDRRAGPRRNNENGRPAQPWSQSDRRQRRGRRKDD
jgi:hypothetical protein